MSETKKATTNEEIVALLRDDMKGEHSAIIQYLQHAYKMGEGEVPSDVEGIARDEMRHFRWLGELVVELGGNPTMERDPIFLDTPQDFELLLLDIEAEDRAIAQYEAHVAAIDHPKVKRVLERILVDERTHRLMFVDFVKELGGDPHQKLNPTIGPWAQAPAESQDLEIGNNGETKSADMDKAGRDDHPFVRMLNSRIRQEYLTVLSYLHRGFTTWNADPQLSRSLIDDRAVWHMTHLGTISEAVAGLKATPEIFVPPLPMADPSVSKAAFNAWGIQNEGELAENTRTLLAQIKAVEKEGDADEAEELESLERDLKRYEKHELFIQQQFEEDK